jgi:hypothetical protein
LSHYCAQIIGAQEPAAAEEKHHNHSANTANINENISKIIVDEYTLQLRNTTIALVLITFIVLFITITCGDYIAKVTTKRLKAYRQRRYNKKREEETELYSKKIPKLTPAQIQYYEKDLHKAEQLQQFNTSISDLL